MIQRSHSFKLSPTSIGAVALAAILVGGLYPSPAFAAKERGTIKGRVRTRPSKLKRYVVVHLVKVDGDFRPPRRVAEIDQKGMKFVPHVLPILKGTRVRFLNNDSVRHNVFTPDGSKYNLGTWGEGESKTHRFKKRGVYRQLCNLHPEMEGYVVVLDNPYFAKADKRGRFKIKNVPPGEYTVRAWGPRLKAKKKKITVSAGETTTVKFSLRRR